MTARRSDQDMEPRRDGSSQGYGRPARRQEADAPASGQGALDLDSRPSARRRGTNRRPSGAERGERASAGRPREGVAVEQDRAGAAGRPARREASSSRAASARGAREGAAGAARPARRPSTDARAANGQAPEARERAASVPQQNDQALDSAHGRELMGRFHTVGILAVAAVVALGCLIGLLFFLRPAVSQFENRTLTPFPKLSASSFFDGSFFTDVSLWYSDTYPLREPLVKADQAFESLYGIEPEVQVVGSGRVADELPVVPDEADVEAQDGAEQQEAPQDPLVDDPLLDEQIIVPDERVIAAEVQAALMDGLYVDGDAAYSIYYFAQEAVQRYARALNLAATNLAGHARVFSIIVPNSSGIMLSQEVQDSLGGSDQREAIKYFYSLYEDGVTDVFIFDLLREHNDEYVYYRTDHHWTMRGAYYGYLAFCEKAGIDAVTLDERAYLDNGSFLGSYYNELGLASMDANPDTLDTWIPNGTNEMTFMDTDGQWYDGEVVQDVHDWDPLYKSNYLVNGDPPLARIDNPALPEGQTLLVVMDSFGCSLTPLLVDNYKCVWIIDPRYYDGNIVSFALENEVDDVLFVNSMSLAGTDPISMALLSKVQAEQPADQTQTQLATTEQTDVQEP